MLTDANGAGAAVRVCAMAPFAKQRPRVTRRGTFMDKGYEARRDKLWTLFRAHGWVEKITGPLMLAVTGRFKGKGRKLDLDNFLGGVMDSLNQRLYDDDSQVVRSSDALRIERNTGRDEIVICWQALPTTDAIMQKPGGAVTPPARSRR